MSFPRIELLWMQKNRNATFFSGRRKYFFCPRSSLQIYVAIFFIELLYVVTKKLFLGLVVFFSPFHFLVKERQVAGSFINDVKLISRVVDTPTEILQSVTSLTDDPSTKNSLEWNFLLFYSREFVVTLAVKMFFRSLLRSCQRVN
jgi:hypothetical protein